MRTVLNGRGKPVVLTRENYGYGWDDMDWPVATFRTESIWTYFLHGHPDPHIRVPHKDGETAHRVRGRRWRIAGLLP